MFRSEKHRKSKHKKVRGGKKKRELNAACWGDEMKTEEYRVKDRGWRLDGDLGRAGGEEEAQT